jgi:hypothetical protein
VNETQSVVNAAIGVLIEIVEETVVSKVDEKDS